MVAIPGPLAHPHGWPDDAAGVVVHRGPLLVEYRDEEPQCLDGAVTVSWAGRPRLTWQAVPTESEQSLLARLLHGEDAPVSVAAPLDPSGQGLLRGGPNVPPEGRVVGGRVPGGRLETGDRQVLDSLDFLLPNGPRAFDLGLVRDAADSDQGHHGRMSTTGGGWSVTVDQHPRADQVFSDLDERGGYRVTHMARLMRTDGSLFDARDALADAHGVAAAYSFAAGHRCAPVLLAGSAGCTVMWAEASHPSADPWTDRVRWTDPTNMHAQLVSVVSGWLDQWSDPSQRLVLRLALGYHLGASNGSPADMAVLAGIAGLVLLSEARYVGGTGSRRAGGKGFTPAGRSVGC